MCRISGTAVVALSVVVQPFSHNSLSRKKKTPATLYSNSNPNIKVVAELN